MQRMSARTAVPRSVVGPCVLALLTASALSVAAGCASVPPPREQIATARAKVRAAQNEQAAEHAPLELRQAQDALDQAESQLEKEQNLDARRNAELATVQAELALARTERARARAAVEELTRTVAALRDEIEIARSLQEDAR